MLETELIEKNQPTSLKFLLKMTTFLITILLILLIIYGIKLGIFQDKTIMINYIKKFGIFAPICFLLLQILQVVIPIIPGGVSCLAGVIAFGPILGFLYNYIGLLIGSCLAYFLAKKYGLKIIQKLFKSETITKYLKYIKSNSFSKIFCLGIFLPGLPDDLLCYIAGISNLSFKNFLIILVLGKPISLLTYSLFMKLL